MSDIEGKTAREAASEWSRRAARDIDGKTERSNGREHMSQCGQRASFNGTDGISDIEGKAAREAVSECGQRASFNSGFQSEWS